MSDLTDTLERILIYLEENETLRGIRFESLQPGLTRADIDELTADLPFRLPVDVYELYQWEMAFGGVRSPMEIREEYQIIPPKDMRQLDRSFYQKRWSGKQ